MPRTSVLRYLDVLEAVFLTVRIPAWSVNLGQREIRAPKIFLTDPGLAAALRRADIDQLMTPESSRGLDGPLIEGFVLAELLRQSSVSGDPPILSHYRERDGSEIDLIVEAPDGRVAGIEIKAGPGATASSARHLISLRNRVGDRFEAGVVLHTGPRATSLSERIAALPLSTLWS